MIRFPTRRAAVIAGAGCLLILAGATATAGWLFVLAAGALGLVAGSFVVRHRLGSVEIARTGPTRMRVGDEVAAGLTLHNRSSSNIPMFMIEDPVAAFDPIRVGTERLPGNSTARVELIRNAERRGVFGDSKVTLTSGAPFGLVRSRRHQVVAGEMTVVPQWVDLRSFPFLDPSAAVTEDPDERPMAGTGQDFMGIREYRAGDPLRSVHWRSTARAARLIVREYEREVSTRIGILLAGADHGEGPRSSFETMVSTVASIGLHALNAGHAIYVARPGPGAGQRLWEPSPNELLDWLAAAQPEDVPLASAVDDLSEAVGDRAPVIVVASDAGETGRSIPAVTRSLHARGGQALLILAQTATWDPRESPTLDIAEALEGRATRVLRADRELEACLAG